MDGKGVFTLINREVVASALSRRCKTLLIRRRVEGVLIENEHFKRKAVREELVKRARHAELVVGQPADTALALDVKMRYQVFFSIDRQLLIDDIAL